MREIKFRAWDKKKMYAVERIDFFQEFTASYSSIDGMHNAGEDILMQYTGLVDKNGTEIYEGDIVKRDYGYPEEEQYVDYIETIYDLYRDPEAIHEVIGNIYENPELLEE